MTLIPTSLKREYSKWLRDQVDINQNKFISSSFSIFDSAKFKSFLRDFSSGSVDTSMSLSELLKLEVKDGKLVIPDKNNKKSSDDEAILKEIDIAQEEALDADDEGEGEEVTDSDEVDEGEDIDYGFAESLNGLLEDKDFQTILDTDGDGEVSDKELGGFLSAISAIDGDKDNISVDDILGGLQKAAMEAEKLINDDIDSKKRSSKKDNSSKSDSSGSCSNSGSSAGGSGSVGGGGCSSCGNNFNGGNVDNIQKTNSDNYENMTDEQLAAAKQKAQTNRDASKTAVDNAKQNVETAKSNYDNEAQNQDDAVNAAQQELDNKQADYDTVKEQFSEDIANALKNVQDKQTEINDAQTTVNSASDAVADAASAVGQATDDLASAQADLAATPATIETTDAEGNTVVTENPEYPAKVAAVEAAQAALEQKQQELEAKQTELENAQSELEARTAERDELQGVYDETVQNSEFAENEALQAITDATKGVSEAQDARKEALDTAREEITNASDTLKTESETYKSNNAELNKITTVQTYRETHPNVKTANGVEYDSEKQSMFAKVAEAVANKWSTINNCTNGVVEALNSLGYNFPLEYAADMLPYFQGNSDFTVTQISPDQVSSQPEGTIIIYQRNCDQVAQWAGHIAVELSGGREASDHVASRIQPSYGTVHAIYMKPKNA